jgi:hypothetical protein
MLSLIYFVNFDLDILPQLQHQKLVKEKILQDIKDEVNDVTVFNFAKKNQDQIELITRDWLNADKQSKQVLISIMGFTYTIRIVPIRSV